MKLGNSPMLTVMFAFVLFLGGLATHFVSARVRVGVLLLGLLLFLATAGISIGLPVA